MTNQIVNLKTEMPSIPANLERIKDKRIDSFL